MSNDFLSPTRHMVAFLFKIADFELAVFMGVDMWTRLIKSIGGPSKAGRRKGD